ncbi:hypothetical protein [Sphingosinicella terrae]|uniref:hypothetical protein n=1 Tax=Sphingosinicella terrae TaxID=2172047 RepID=UPI000E0D5983|nr:hypothetical protein [Sphingosinicella terrae]
MTEQDFERMPLTPYDEYPVHATPYPMSYVPNTDYAWDDGYFFMIYDLDAGIQMWNGMRIAPNSNIIGGHSAFNVRGVQRTLRLSRIWRDDFSVAIGPLRYEFIEPLRATRMVLEPNESGMSYDLVWRGLAPPHLSAHHRAVRNGRFTTDQSRYNQVGTATGWLEIDGERTIIDEARPWGGSRDRSWGVYESRPPLLGPGKWLPPAPPPPIARALRFSCFLESEGFSSYFHFHEGPEGENVPLNDAFGTPFEGWINHGWDGPELKLVGHRHALAWRPGTRSMTSGTVVITDEKGGDWTLEMEVKLPPHVLGTIGYHVGAWRDGGTIHTYHGASPALEWDEFDFSSQPCDHVFPGTGETRKLFGVEHLAAVRVTAPDGSVTVGRAQIEIFLNGRYAPYGFEGQSDQGGLTGRGIA